MKVIHPNVPIEVVDHSHITPAIPATENCELVKLMLTRKSSESTPSLIEKMSKRISDQYGVEKRYLSSKPFIGQFDVDVNSESLASTCVHHLQKKYLKEVDCILLGTTTPVRYTGSQAAAISTITENLPACYDVKAGCSTSLATLHNASMFLNSGTENVLVVTAETLSKVIHPINPETWFGLADGAAAVILRRTQKPQFIIRHSYFSVDGAYVNAYTVPAALPPHNSTQNQDQFYMQGDGQLMEEIAYKKYVEMMDYLQTNNILKKIQYFIPHQVNLSLILKVQDKYTFHPKRIWDAKEIGNIGGSSILYSLSKLLKEHTFKSGDHILMMSVGGGISSSFQVWEKI